MGIGIKLDPNKLFKIKINGSYQPPKVEEPKEPEQKVEEEKAE
jgi:hypothetical protein